MYSSSIRDPTTILFCFFHRYADDANELRKTEMSQKSIKIWLENWLVTMIRLVVGEIVVIHIQR